MPTATRRQSYFLRPSQEDSKLLTMLPNELLVMISHHAIGNFDGDDKPHPALVQATSLKLVSKIFAVIVDETLVAFSRHKDNGHRMSSIACEPNHKSLQVLKAVAANPTIAPVIGRLSCTKPTTVSADIRSKFQDFKTTILKFQGLYAFSTGESGEEISWTFSSGTGETYEENSWTFSSAANQELFFYWHALVIKAFSQAIDCTRFEGMLGLRAASIPALSSWTAKPYKFSSRSLQNITRICIDIHTCEFDNSPGDGAAWQVILSDARSLGHLEFTASCSCPRNWCNNREGVKEFVASCLYDEHWEKLHSLRIDTAFDQDALISTLQTHGHLYLLHLLLNPIDYEDAYDFIGLLDEIRDSACFCNASIRVQESFACAILEFDDEQQEKLFTHNGKSICSCKNCNWSDIGAYVLGAEAHYSEGKRLWCGPCIHGDDDDEEEE